ncbi:Aste57867_3803 [Aphanomyces stellatus]|uniref:Aste57867_3803 protein n=1 Tax=Aphanomyces stellatus TaxID=120398 RepID=A0A485KFT9_9STRA|nr:hypothetical protein As57867_003792 [Aphanomyces stellatus]VFT80952.1 Aste57867_3803 [Aphanomyces stellatus]
MVPGPALREQERFFDEEDPEGYYTGLWRVPMENGWAVWTKDVNTVAFTDGIPKDLIAFRRVYVSNSFYSNADEVDAAMTPWLQVHGLGRIPLLVECVRNAKFLVMYYAAEHGRVDLLEFLHTHNHHLNSTNLLYELASVHDHETVVEFLHQVGYQQGNDYCLQYAIRGALRVGHTPILKFLLQTFHGVDRFDEWLTDDNVQYAVEDHTTEALAFVLNERFPATNPSMATSVLPKC